MTLRWCALLLLLTGCAGEVERLGSAALLDAGTLAAPPLVGSCTEGAVRAQASAEAQTILDRAFAWVDAQVGYCQCVIQASSPYRSDCSGFVSYAWGLPSPGDTTSEFAGGPAADGRSVRTTWGALQIGDALNFPGDAAAGTGHIMLFAGWLDSAQTKLCAVEETVPGTSASLDVYWLSESASGFGGQGTLQDIFLPIRKAP